jgi:hypothetical protein
LKKIGVSAGKQPDDTSLALLFLSFTVFSPRRFPDRPFRSLSRTPFQVKVPAEGVKSGISVIIFVISSLFTKNMVVFTSKGAFSTPCLPKYDLPCRFSLTSLTKCPLLAKLLYFSSFLRTHMSILGPFRWHSRHFRGSVVDFREKGVIFVNFPFLFRQIAAPRLLILKFTSNFVFFFQFSCTFRDFLCLSFENAPFVPFDPSLRTSPSLRLTSLKTGRRLKHIISRAGRRDR